MSDPSAADRAPDLDQLFAACQDRLRRRIRLMMGDGADRVGESGDFLGNVYLRLRRDVPPAAVRDERHFLNFATRVARNLIVDQVRRPRVARFDSLSSSFGRAELADVSARTPSMAADAAEAGVRVLEVLEEMEPDHRAVIELRDFEGLSFKEIADRMARTENAVQILHRRALIRLGGEMRRRGGAPSR
jgi:RNA polymerase sigma-70 factor (ECF subfamily)